MVLLFYTTYISVYLAHHEIFRAKVGTGGISGDIIRNLASGVYLLYTRRKSIWLMPSSIFRQS